jgi:DHA3 family tetracycline resistance protein-like MFS transporter
VFYIVTFLIDIPTGVFADVYSRRKAFVIGCALRCVALTSYFFSKTFAFFLIAEIIDGIGTSFCNGALDAWAIDALDRSGFEGPKDRIISRASQFSNLGLIVTPVFGATVANFDIGFPWLLGAGGFILSAVIGNALREQPIAAPMPLLRPLGIPDQIFNAACRGFAVTSIRYLCIAEAIILASLTSFSLEWPMLVRQTYGAEIWVIGWMVGTFSVARIAGAQLALKMPNTSFGRSRYLVICIIIGSSLLFGAGAINDNLITIIGLLILLNVCIGAKEPLALAWINELLTADERATMLSFRSMCATIGASLGLLMGGYVAKQWGISVQWMVGGAVLAVSAFCYVRAGVRRSELLSLGKVD